MSEALHDNKEPVRLSRVLELSALLISLITGLMTASLVVFKGGALVNTIQNHEARLTKIEATGSPPIAEHIKLDDEREARTRENLKDLKDNVAKLVEVVGKVDVLNAKVDSLKDQIAKKQ